MYRNTAYLYKEQVMRVYTWDEQGNRIHIDTTYEPYIYTETSNNPVATSIFNTGLKKITFRNNFDRNKYIKSTSNKRIFEHLPPAQQFLVDTYWETNDTPDFSKHQLKIYLLDIETYSPDGFPDESCSEYRIY